MTRPGVSPSGLPWPYMAERKEEFPGALPADHPLAQKYHPIAYRETGLLEVLCDHGVGHPVPASAEAMDRRHGHAPGTWGLHSCDGCCLSPAALDQALKARKARAMTRDGAFRESFRRLAAPV